MKNKEKTNASIIEYAQRKLHIDNRSSLRYPPYVLLFLKILLNEETRRSFSAQQYKYAVNFLYGKRIELSYDDAIKYLLSWERAYEKHEVQK